jgi:flagellar hook-basal body complex protein FliE
MEIQPIQMPLSLTQPMVLTPIAPLSAGNLAQTQEIAPANFKDFLKKAVSDVNATQLDGTAAIQNLATGGSENLHDVMMAMEKASLTLQYAIQVRNKLLEAYQSVIQMQI